MDDYIAEMDGEPTIAEKQRLVQAELEQAKQRGQDQAAARRGKKRCPLVLAQVLERLSLGMRRDALGQPVFDEKDPNAHRRAAFNMILGEDYPPCTVPLKELNKMMLKDVLMDTHHHGKYLLLRICSTDHTHSGTHQSYAVVDELGQHEFLIIHMFAIPPFHNAMIPQEAILAIKKPYFKTIVDQDCALCIDHPSDVIFLDHDDALIPNKWKTGSSVKKSAKKCLQSGVAAFHKQNYYKAEKQFTKGLACCPPGDDALRRELYRRRAEVRSHLGLYQDAWSDGYIATIDGGDKTAYYTMAMSAYQLGEFGKAKEAFDKLLPSFRKEYRRTLSRINEHDKGEYNWEITGTAAHGKYTEHSTYKCRTYIAQTKSHGRGLFAKEYIEAGELVLVEKAFIFVNSSAKPSCFNLVIPHKSSRGVVFGAQSDMWYHMVRKCRSTMQFAPGDEPLALYAGPDYPPLESTEIPIVDDVPVFDVFRMEKIVEYNAFGYAHDPKRTTFGNASMATAGNDGLNGSLGIWLRSSAINHSCVFNAEHSFVGDMIIFRATRDIDVGEEITTFYREIDADYDTRNEAFQAWNFTCDCRLCIAERVCPETPARKSLLQESKDLLREHPITSATTASLQTIHKIHSLLHRLEDTYPDKFYKHLPRLGVIPLHQYLAYHHSANDLKEALIHSKYILNAHGYKIGVSGVEQDVRVDRRWAISTPIVVDHVMNHSKYALKQGNAKLSDSYAEFAMELYMTINGEESGFEQRYGFSNVEWEKRTEAMEALEKAAENAANLTPEEREKALAAAQKAGDIVDGEIAEELHKIANSGTNKDDAETAAAILESAKASGNTSDADLALDENLLKAVATYCSNSKAAATDKQKDKSDSNSNSSNNNNNNKKKQTAAGKTNANTTPAAKARAKAKASDDLLEDEILLRIDQAITTSLLRYPVDPSSNSTKKNNAFKQTQSAALLADIKTIVTEAIEVHVNAGKVVGRDVGRWMLGLKMRLAGKLGLDAVQKVWDDLGGEGVGVQKTTADGGGEEKD